MTRPRVVAIVPSAGHGKRLGGKGKKPFVRLAGRPLVVHALSAINSCKAVDAIIVACERSRVGEFRRLVKRFKLNKITDIVAGGKTRHESVKNCLDKVTTDYDIVLIHDGARPLVEKSLIEESVRAAARFGACVAAVPEIDTVKLAGRDLFVAGTLDRSRLFRAQTPQAFRRAVILRAYSAKKDGPVTDDASLVEKLDMRVKIIKGSYRNIKITTMEDLKLAEVLL